MTNLISISKRIASAFFLAASSQEAELVHDFGYSFDPWKFSKSVGIHPDSTKEFHAALVEGEEVVAVLFTGRSGNLFGFDIAVSPQAQRKGYGSRLMDIAIDEFEDISDFWEDLEFHLDAVNPVAVRMLEQRGFEVVGQRGEHTYLTRR